MPGDELDDIIEEEPEDIPAEGPLDYQDIVTEEPERPVDDILDEIGGAEFHGGLSEAESAGGKLSDLQAIVSHLTPKYKDEELNELARSARVARTYPDNVLDKNFLIVMSRYEKHCDEEGYDFMRDVSLIQDFVSIGIEGRGIADLLELAGVAHDEEMEKLSEKLGF